MATSSFLRNRYWVLRHGKSIPNEKGLIVSSLKISSIPCYCCEQIYTADSKVSWILTLENTWLACDCFNRMSVLGTRKGRKVHYFTHRSIAYQVQELKENNIPLENVHICYSPFARTRHTAEVVVSVLNIPFDGPQCKYPEIWALDEKDPFMRPEGGESVDDVVSRLASAVATMESDYQGCAILVVSHGNPLQILQTILNAASAQMELSCSDLALRIQAVKVLSILSQHRKFAMLTGELRTVL